MNRAINTLWRTLKKLIWFCLCAMLALFMWIALYNLLWRLAQHSFTPTPVIMATTSLLLLGFMTLDIAVTRKSRLTIIRWTGKALVWVCIPMVLCTAALLGLVYLDARSPTPTPSTTQAGGQQPALESLPFELQGLLAATNQERNNHNLQPLTMNALLNESAARKCEDMAVRNYWDHNTPEGTEPWEFIQAAGYQYQKAGENLAYGFLDEEAVVRGWMESPTHRDNLLGMYQEVGFAVCTSDNYQNEGKQQIVVQHLGMPR